MKTHLFLLVAVLGACLPAWAQINSATGLSSANVTMSCPATAEWGPSCLVYPVDLQFLPDGRMVVIEQSGAVKIRHTDGSMVLAHRFTVDLDSERGLLGVAVDPHFSQTSRLFFYYSRTNANGGSATARHVVVSMTLLPNETLDPASEYVLVNNLRGPANHNGGGLAVGPIDEKLYVGVGDTGCNCGCAPGTGMNGSNANSFGSCLTNGNGKILRVELDGGVPSDNPLVGETAVTACGATCTSAISASTTAPGRTDLWAWGFRNPFRFNFDKVTGKLWVGDVGEVTHEEINIVEKGKHYGWPWREGGVGGVNNGGQPATTCATLVPISGDCVDPAWFCSRSDCSSITGGTFIDNCAWPASQRGKYFFADYGTGNVMSLTPNGARDAVSAMTILGTVSSVTAIREGVDQNLYLVRALQAGRVVRVTATTPLSCGDGGVLDAGVPDAGAIDAGSTDAGNGAGGGSGA
ncbi:MAG: PQQ-dependent sugar dehydrogenase, partial [Myxococcaceae bacterium]|nr:PQQ-dependent sugar dehydrogenase [Myxococcaceae bacterium]